MGYPIPFGMVFEKLVPYHQIYHTFPTRTYNDPQRLIKTLIRELQSYNN